MVQLKFKPGDIVKSIREGSENYGKIFTIKGRYVLSEVSRYLVEEDSSIALFEDKLELYCSELCMKCRYSCKSNKTECNFVEE